MQGKYLLSNTLIPLDMAAKIIIDKIVLTDAEQREHDLFLEEFKTRGGMDDEELIARLGAIPFDEFMRRMSEKIRNYKQ